MGPPGTRDTAATRRRYFALAVAGGLVSSLIIGVTVGTRSSAPPRAGGSASQAAAQAASTKAPAPGSPAAKASAEDALANGAGAGAPPPQPLDSHAAKTPTVRIVQYHGYQVKVPGSWPVYDLASDPSRCVLFSTHAVYLGIPGTVQNCPANAVGHTESLLIQPASSASAPPSAIVLPGASTVLPQRTALPAAAAAAASVGQLIQVEVPGPGVLVTAAFGTNLAQIRAILAGATPGPSTSSGSGTSSRSGGSSGSGASSGSGPSATPSASSSASAASAPGSPPATQGLMATGSEPLRGQSASARRAPSAVAAPQLSGMTGSGLGFDTCTAPSVATMTAWLASPYRVVGTYLGGMNWACSYGNFNASWVRQVAGEGWRFMPLWVGRQAPCTNAPFVATITLAHANAQGRSEAASAVAAARKFGYGPGTPIYFDMEGYNSNPSCRRAVLNFLGAWTNGLHAAGYASGVYSSASSGIRNLAGQYGNASYPRPNDIWIADWTNVPVLTDPAVPNAFWANHQRLHQYSGPHGETWGGRAIQMDTDAADGLVAGLRTAPVLRGPVETAGPSELAVAPGHSARVQLTLRGMPNTPVTVRWQATAHAGLAVTPNHGTVDLWPGGVLSVPLTLKPSVSLPHRRYDVPIAVIAGSKVVATTFLLVSVVPAGQALPTPQPMVLYAADPASMSVAAATARALALPPGDVTGSFSRAWFATASGRYLVYAVGKAAANALYFNVCGWANPAKRPAGSTPFYYPGEPLRAPLGRYYFELSDMNTTAGTAALTTQLTQYAIAGTLPDYGSVAAAPAPPTLACLGSPNVPVP